MSYLLLLLAAGAPSAVDEVESGNVRIRVHVQASRYTYEVANLGRDSITSFEVAFANGYDFHAPKGWETEHVGDIFRAWSRNEKDAIHGGDARQFSVTVSSLGSVLGRVPARVETRNGGSITLKNVWGGVLTPRGQIMLTACLTGGIFIFHYMLLARGARRSARTAIAP